LSHILPCLIHRSCYSYSRSNFSDRSLLYYYSFSDHLLNWSYSLTCSYYSNWSYSLNRSPGTSSASRLISTLIASASYCKEYTQQYKQNYQFFSQYFTL